MATTQNEPTAQELISQAFINDPTLLSTTIAANSWNDWTGGLSPALKGQVSKATTDANNLAGAQYIAAVQDRGQYDKMTGDYNNLYRPAGEKYGKVVNDMGTDAYKAQQRGIATSGVQQQADAQMQAAQRNMQRMGINPSSGRALAMNNQNAIQTAALKAGAANASDRNVLKDYTSGLKDMTAMGLDSLKAAQYMDGSAQKWATLGLDASQVGAKLGIDYGKLAGSQASAYGDLANKAAYTQNIDTKTAADIQARNDSNSIPNLLIAGAVKAGSTSLDKLAGKAGDYLGDKVASWWDTPKTLDPSNPDNNANNTSYSPAKDSQAYNATLEDNPYIPFDNPGELYLDP